MQPQWKEKHEDLIQKITEGCDLDCTQQDHSRNIPAYLQFSNFRFQRFSQHFKLYI